MLFVVVKVQESDVYVSITFVQNFGVVEDIKHTLSFMKFFAGLSYPPPSADVFFVAQATSAVAASSAVAEPAGH